MIDAYRVTTPVRTLSFPSIPAEKLHAYTFARNGKQSSRIKDLVDMILLIQSGEMDDSKLLSVIRPSYPIIFVT